MSVKKQGFIQGAMILMAANILIKLIGALFKIPLTNMVGDTTMAYFNSAYSFYVLFFMISTSGLPVAVSRMIAAANARNNKTEINRIFKISFRLFFILGITGTAIMAALSRVFANMAEMPEAFRPILAISPTVFFICIISSFRGYFQGHQNMTPTAFSQTIEALGKLFIGLAAGKIAIDSGCSESEVAAYVILGVTVGVVFSCLSLIIAKYFSQRDEKARDSRLDPPEKMKTSRQLTKELISIAIPITVASSIMSLTGVIDTSLVVSRLINCGVDEQSAIKMFGAYTSKSVTMYNLPPTLIYPFSISLIPTVSAAVTLGDKKKLKHIVISTMRIVSVISVPCAIGLSAMARPVLSFLYTNNAVIYINAAGKQVTSLDVAAPLLSVLAIAVFFVGMIAVTGAVLQGHGYERLSIISTFVGVLIKFVSAYILIGIPSIGIYGTPISTILCYFVMLCMNFAFIAKFTGLRPSLSEVLMKPFLASAACGLSAVMFYTALSLIHKGRIATAVSIVLAIVVYVVVLCAIGGISRDDLILLPKGKRIISLFTKLKLIKD
ncbi:MAG: polysaccharide biosynthesis protein [Oscillospiraceae bacterium]|nr:polysaccharide biosynthesis protein [Oscillospiraceae bacterium]